VNTHTNVSMGGRYSVKRIHFGSIIGKEPFCCCGRCYKKWSRAIPRKIRPGNRPSLDRAMLSIFLCRVALCYAVRYAVRLLSLAALCLCLTTALVGLRQARYASSVSCASPPLSACCSSAATCCTRLSSVSLVGMVLSSRITSTWSRSNL